MINFIKLLAVSLFFVPLSGCMYYLERGFGGSEMNRYSFSWMKIGADKGDVISAMRFCGFIDFDAGYGKDNSSNAMAEREECMFQKGFKYSDGWGGYCSKAEYMAILPTCKKASERERRDYSDEWEKPWAGKSAVLQAMKECGYTRLTLGYGDDTSINAFAAREECMFAKGLTYRNRWGGLCSESDYRAKLPTCKNAPVRPRYE